jgi:hypothetical protein
MHRTRFILTLLTLLSVLALVLAACGTAKAPAATAVPAAETVLELTGPNGTQAFTLDQIKALPVTEGWGGNKSSAGVITIPSTYKGVALKDLVAALDGTFDDTMGVTLTAEDGYSMTYSFNQVANGNFTAYDPANGAELTAHDPLTAILAYEVDGKPLDPIQDGTLRLQVVSVKNNQVVDGHWTEKWVVKMDVKAVGQTWKLKLHGALMQPVDRATFQSCASPSCHGVGWMDDSGQNWVGVPLWLLVGEVDDGNSHEDGAFNDALADAGYQVDVVGADGYTVTLDSVSIKRNSHILVAYLVNDAELPEKYYPLRLVGSDLTKGQMAGQIDMIVVHIPEASMATAVPTAGVTAAAPAAVAGSLSISGLVANPLSLSEGALRAMSPVTISAEQPKKGTQSFTGVRLNTLLDVAQVQAAATKLVLTAGDGYSAEIDLATVRACADCMIAFTDTPGSFFAVMPGQQGNLWVKDVIKIEVK